jgi:hypothetical protein
MEVARKQWKRFVCASADLHQNGDSQKTVEKIFAGGPWHKITLDAAFVRNLTETDATAFVPNLTEALQHADDYMR